MLRSILITFAALTLTVVNCDSDVLDYSDKDLDEFKSAVGKFEIALVEFFAPWCGHCKRLAPEYERAATVLKKNDPPIPLVKVDCTSDKGTTICGKYDVSGYPTLKIFKDGELDSDYSGQREADSIVKTMKTLAGPASKEHTSFQSLNKALEKSDEVIVIGVFDSASDELAKTFHKAADRLREKATFAHVYKSSASGDLSDLQVIKGDAALSVPSVVLVRPKVLKNKFEPSFVVYEDSSESLDNFIRTNYHGLAGHRTHSNMGDFNAPLVIVYYDVDYVKNPKGTNYWRNRVLKVAEKVPKVRFAVANADQFASEMDEFGLESRSGRDAAPVVGARNENGNKYVMTEKFSVDALEKFVDDFLAGKLEQYVKSEAVPENNDLPVKVAVGKNFDELVVKSKKDVLIEFYAPWCGHCKKLAPAYEELGKQLQDEPYVDIIKMDATANDVKEPFTVHGFPTIYWYPSDTKHPKKYEGGRDTKDFLNFIAKHATVELEGYDRSGKPKKVKEEL